MELNRSTATVQRTSYEISFDERKVQILTPVKVRHPAGRKYRDAVALWDTGSTFSLISRSLANELGLSPLCSGESETAAGRFRSVDYSVSLWLSDRLWFQSVHAIEFPGAQNFDFIIGMDIIAGGNLAIRNDGSKTVLHFEYPVW